MLVVEKCSNFFIVVNRPSAKLRILLLQFNVECLAEKERNFLSALFISFVIFILLNNPQCPVSHPVIYFILRVAIKQCKFGCSVVIL